MYEVTIKGKFTDEQFEKFLKENNCETIKDVEEMFRDEMGDAIEKDRISTHKIEFKKITQSYIGCITCINHSVHFATEPCLSCKENSNWKMG